MDKKNYYNKINELHHQVVADIKKMMEDYGKVVVDLMGSPAQYAYVVGKPEFMDEDEYCQADVLAVILEDNQIKLDINWGMDSDEYLEKYPNENDDISDLYAVVDADNLGVLVPCAGIDEVYDSVYEYLTNGYKGDRDE